MILRQEQTELWKQFNLGECSQDPGGGILYAIRYDIGDLEGHQAVVANVLFDSKAVIHELSDGLAISMDKVAEERRDRVALFLEEISVVNEALEYHRAGLNVDSIKDLSGRLSGAYMSRLTNEGKIEAYNLASLAIPQITGDLFVAHWQNQVLSPQEHEQVAELQAFGARQTDMLNTHGTVIIGQNALFDRP